MVTLLPYPGHAAPIDQQSEAVVMGHFRRAMRLDRARWCPVWMLPGLGILHGARGAPRCPVSTVRAVAAHAWWRGDCWGPAPLRQQQRQCWEELSSWSRCALPEGMPEAASRGLERVRRCIREAAHALFWGAG